MMPIMEYSSQYASPNIVVVPQTPHMNKPELEKVITQNVCHTQTEKVKEPVEYNNPNLKYCQISTNVFPNDIKQNIRDGLFEIEAKGDNLESQSNNNIKSEETFIAMTNKGFVELPDNNNDITNDKNTKEHDYNDTQHDQIESINRILTTGSSHSKLNTPITRKNVNSIFKNISSNNNNQDKAIRKCSSLLRRKMKKCIKKPKHYLRDVKKSSMKTTSTKLFKTNKRLINIIINLVPSHANKIPCIDNNKENSINPPIESPFVDVGFLEDFNVDEIVDSLRQTQPKTEEAMALNLEHEYLSFSEDKIKNDVDKNDEERSAKINTAQNGTTDMTENDDVDVSKLTNTHNHTNIMDFCNKFEKQIIQNDLDNLKITTAITHTTENTNTIKIDTNLNQNFNQSKESDSIGKNGTHKLKSEVGKIKSKRFCFFKSKHVNIVKHKSSDTKKLKSQRKMDLKYKTFMRHQDKTNKNNSEDNESHRTPYYNDQKQNNTKATVDNSASSKHNSQNFYGNEDKGKETLNTHERTQTKIKKHTEKDNNIDLVKPCWVLLTTLNEKNILLTNNLVMRKNPATCKNKYNCKNYTQKPNEMEVLVPSQQDIMYKSDTNISTDVYDKRADISKSKLKLQTIIKTHKRQLSLENFKIIQNSPDIKNKQKVSSEESKTTVDKNRCIKDLLQTSTNIEPNKPGNAINNKIKFRNKEEHLLKKHTTKNKNGNNLHDFIQKTNNHNCHIKKRQNITIYDEDLSEVAKNCIKRSKTKTRHDTFANKRNIHVKSQVKDVNNREDKIPIYKHVNIINNNSNSSENTKIDTETNTIESEEQSKTISNKDDIPNLINDYKQGSIINLSQLNVFKKDDKDKINHSDLNDKIGNNPEIIIKGDNKANEFIMNTKTNDKYQTAAKENINLLFPHCKIRPSLETVHTLQTTTINSKKITNFTIPKHQSDVTITKNTNNNETPNTIENKSAVAIGNKNKNKLHNNVDDDKIQKKNPTIKIPKMETTNNQIAPKALSISKSRLDRINDNISEKITNKNESSNKTINDEILAIENKLQIMDDREHKSSCSPTVKMPQIETNNNEKMSIDCMSPKDKLDSLCSNMVEKNTNHNAAHKPETEIVLVNTINNRKGNVLNDNKKTYSNFIPKLPSSSKIISPNEKGNPTNKILLKTPSKFENNVSTSSLFTMLEKSLLKCFKGKVYTMVNLIHRGTFSDIVKYKDASGKFFAIKVLKDKHIPHVYNYLKGIQKDRLNENYYYIWVHQYIPNPSGNIISLMMEYYPTNLKQVLEEMKKGFRIDLVQKLCKQLITAVLILRCNKLIHSDIKPTHILLNETHDRLKLCGFDEANNEEYYKNRIPRACCIGSAQYRAPEIILGVSASNQNNNFGYGIDVWSTACVMYEMVTNTLLFPGPSNNDVLYQQSILLGNMTKETVATSSFKNAYFQNEKFMRKETADGKVVPTEIPARKPQQLFRTLVEIYFKHWDAKTNPKQLTDDMCELRKFEKVLSEMLAMEPKNRITIEFALANPFIYK